MSELKRFFNRAAALNPLAPRLTSEEEKSKLAKEFYAEYMAEAEFRQFYRRGVDGYLALADKHLKDEIGYSKMTDPENEDGCNGCLGSFGRGRVPLLCQWTYENHGVALVVDLEGFCNHLDLGMMDE